MLNQLAMSTAALFDTLKTPTAIRPTRIGLPASSVLAESVPPSTTIVPLAVDTSCPSTKPAMFTDAPRSMVTLAGCPPPL